MSEITVKVKKPDYTPLDLWVALMADAMKVSEEEAHTILKV